MKVQRKELDKIVLYLRPSQQGGNIGDFYRFRRVDCTRKTQKKNQFPTGDMTVPKPVKNNG